MTATPWLAPRPPVHVAIAAEIRRHPDGGTCSADGRTLALREDFPHRYVVGGVVPSITLPAGATFDAVADAVDRLLPDAVGSGGAIGWWLDGGTLWLDVVTFHASRHVALELARERGELAIFDAHGAVITLASVTR